MLKGKTKERRKILVFDAYKNLVAVFYNQRRLSRILQVTTPTIRGACNGETIQTCGYYLRWYDEALVPLPSLEGMKLRDYDRLTGVSRRVYKDSKMNRKGWKYDTSMTPLKRQKLLRRFGLK